MDRSDVSTWDYSKVNEWLCKEGFGDFADYLTDRHRIDGLVLLELTEEDLKLPCLSIGSLGTIKRLAISIRKLQGNHANCCCSLPNLSKLKCRRIHKKNSVSEVSTSWPSQTISTFLDPEYKKLFISFLYMSWVFLMTSFVMVIVHDRVPDMDKYPPLPDLVLDNLPYIPWAFETCELTAIILSSMVTMLLLFHKHRSIILRRMFALTGTVFLLRCFTMLITSLSVPGTHLECQPQSGNMWTKLERAKIIYSGMGMSLRGVRSCGDYMFSGHTVIVTILNHFFTEYTPNRIPMLHTFSWLLNVFGIFFILAAHEHYSIDVFIAFYITSRLFLYYHSLSNGRILTMCSHDQRTRIWFPLFSYFESSLDGAIPNEYESPITSFKLWLHAMLTQETRFKSSIIVHAQKWINTTFLPKKKK